jgi:DedD protein
MASGGRRASGDRVLESRHLVGLFLGVVLLCGVFFTLGYVMGKTQYPGPVQAADDVTPGPRSLSQPKKTDTPPPASSDWDFYGNAKKPDRLDPAPSNSAASGRSVAASARRGDSAAATSPRPGSPALAKPAGKLGAPWVPKGSIVLQLAALTRESDALALADALQRKRFPSFVVTPSSDNYYRVQVGPYNDATSADRAKQMLEHEGFKPIVKR